MDDLFARLWPRPGACETTGGTLAVDRALRVSAAHESLEAEAELLRADLERDGLDVSGDGKSCAVILTAAERAAEAYRLEIGADGVILGGGTAAGVAYAGRTLRQLLRLSPESLPHARIVDEPRFERRGVMLNISRDKVPTMDSLYALVDQLFDLKLNELQLYTEHTFAYAAHEIVWRDSSPMTAEEVRALDAYCAARHIELVPNQQSFGHLHRWLIHDRYVELAEYPEGVEHPFSPHPEPYGLCAVDPRSLKFLGGLYDELLPNFASKRFNVGLDETVDLGLGRSKERCESLGKHEVYLEFLNGVNALVKERGHRMEYWADEVEGKAELARKLPSDATAMVWGYEANHPFDAKTSPLAEAGLDFVICPGTSSWQSISGRTTNAIGNLRSAADTADRLDAQGMLVCDWGDRGHLQPSCVSALGFTLGAGLAWAPSSGDVTEDELVRILDEQVFLDDARVLGGLFHDLGKVNEMTGGYDVNGTALFFLLPFAEHPHPHERTEGITHESLERAREHLAEIAKRSREASSRRPDAELIGREIRWVCDVLDFAARFGQARIAAGEGTTVSDLEPSVRDALAGEIPGLVAGHEAVWLARNRPGGMQRSRDQLERVGRLLAKEPADNL